MQNWRDLDHWRRLDPDCTFAIAAALERELICEREERGCDMTKSDAWRRYIEWERESRRMPEWFESGLERAIAGLVLVCLIPIAFVLAPFWLVGWAVSQFWRNRGVDK